MRVGRLDLTVGGLALVCVCMVFAIAVYKIESDVNRVTAGSCSRARANATAINAAHQAIRTQANIQILASRQAIASIDRLLKAGTEPPALKSLYEQALRRQHLVIVREQRLRDSVKNVQSLC